MGFTIRDLVQRPPISSGRVAAGETGLNNEIVGFIFLEIPPQHQKISVILLEMKIHTSVRNKIILSSLYAESDNLLGQMETIRTLHAMEAKGLLLFHVGYFIPEVSPQIIQLCNELEFPLVVLPGNVLFSHVMAPILDFMFEDKYHRLHYAQQIYDRISHLVLEEKELPDLIAELQRLIGRGVLLLDYTHACIASCGASLSPEQEQYFSQAAFQYHDRLLKSPKGIPIGWDRGEALLTPISSSLAFYGTLVVVDAQNLSELDQIAISQTQTALGIISLRRIRFADYRMGLLQDYVGDLLHWRFPHEEAAAKQGTLVGCMTTGFHMVLLLKPNELDGKGNSSDACLNGLCDIARNLLITAAPNSLCTITERHVAILLCSKADPTRTRRLACTIGNRIISTVQTGNYPYQVSIGIGQYAQNLSQLSKSYRQAQDTLEISDNLFGPCSCTCYDDVPIYTLLRHVDSHAVQENLCNLMAPLMEYDAQNNTELMDTLRVLLECDLNFVAAAERMYLHKNTIRQRKNKIMELLPIDPFSPPYRGQLEIAFLLKHLLGDTQLSAQ